MIQFYSPDIETTGCLPESDSLHCCRVLRMKEGDEIAVVNGKGTRFRCSIVSADPRHTMIEIIGRESIAKPWQNHITLAVAPTKHSDRIEWLVEKAVEMGVDRIVLLRCKRSERKEMKRERLEKVMVSAMKQSLKSHSTEITEMIDFNEFVESVPSNVQKYFGYCDGDVERNDFAHCYRCGPPVVVMIGPEGDFSFDEVKKAMACGFVPVTFGDSRLRTETAGVFAVAAVHVLNKLAGASIISD